MGSIIGGVVGGLFSKKKGKRQAEALKASGAEGAAIAEAGGSEAARIAEAGGAEAAARFDPFATAGGTANQGVLDALGFGAPGAGDAAFQNFLQSTGFQSQLQAGSQAITGNQAAAGLLNSGSTLKRLTRFGQDLGQQGFSNFLGNLGGVADRGLSAVSGQAGQIGAASRAGAGEVGASGRAGAAAVSGAGQAAADARARGDEGFASGIGQAAGGVFSLLGI